MQELNDENATESTASEVVTASATDAGQRLDVWLEAHLPGLSRSRIQTLIKAHHITVNGHTLKPHTRVHDGMVVFINRPPVVATDLIPEDIPLDVLFEDEDIIVVNKAPGMVVHPAAGHATGTLVHALLHHCADLKGIGGEHRPGIVHRLDKDTSGALVVAKSDSALEGLMRQFKAGEVYKEYVTLVLGVPHASSDTIETLIGRSRHDRKKMSAQPSSGRRAVTEYEVMEAYDAVSLIKVQIHTGRTHQIRVHMAHLGHPVLGDRQYGRPRASESAPRQMLHAQRLAFHHPGDGRRMECVAPMPEDMKTIVGRLRKTLTRKSS